MMNGEKGLVSVIIPTRNRAAYLKKAVAGVLDQSYANVEIIIVANGCTDATGEVVDELRKASPRPIWYLEFSETLGGARARNRGIDRAGGEYIAFLDDDDGWHRDKLRAQVAVLERGQCAIVGSNLVYVYGQPERYRRAGAAPKQRFGIEDLYYENSLGGFSNCMTRKVHIGENRINENLDALQDWDLWLKILQSTQLPACINPACHTFFRLDGCRISGSRQRVIGAQRVFLDAWRGVLDDDAVEYHKMRTDCLLLKAQRQRKYRRYCVQASGVLAAVFNSPYRYNLKRYVHYLMLPLVDIDAMRVGLWSKFKRGKKRTPACEFSSI